MIAKLKGCVCLFCIMVESNRLRAIFCIHGCSDVLFIVCAIFVGEMFFLLSCFMVDVSPGGLCLFDDVNTSIYDLCDGDSGLGGQL